MQSGFFRPRAIIFGLGFAAAASILTKLMRTDRGMLPDISGQNKGTPRNKMSAVMEKITGTKDLQDRQDSEHSIEDLYSEIRKEREQVQELVTIMKDLQRDISRTANQQY